MPAMQSERRNSSSRTRAVSRHFWRLLSCMARVRLSAEPITKIIPPPFFNREGKAVIVLLLVMVKERVWLTRAKCLAMNTLSSLANRSSFACAPWKRKDRGARQFWLDKVSAKACRKDGKYEWSDHFGNGPGNLRERKKEKIEREKVLYSHVFVASQPEGILAFSVCFSFQV